MKRENSIDKSSQSYEWFEQQNTVVDTSLISISGYEWYSFHKIEPIVGPKIHDWKQLIQEKWMELWVSKVTMISLSYNCNNLIIIVWKSSWLDKCRKYSIGMWRDVWLNPVETNPHKQQWVHELARTPATLSQKEQTQDKTMF